MTSAAVRWRFPGEGLPIFDETMVIARVVWVSVPSLEVFVLVLAVAQPDCVPYDVENNAVRHAEMVRRAEAGVVIFPELSLTGYHLDAPAITAEDPRLRPIMEACAETGAVALVGAPVTEEGREYIATLAVDGDGAKVAYRKVHVHTSEERFADGERSEVIEVNGLRLGLAICRDMAVARHAEDTAALGIDVYAAGVVHQAAEVAVQEERARRIATDHRVWVAVASFAGPTGGGFERTAGRSGFWRPGGDLVAQAGPEPGEIVRLTVGRPSGETSRS
ncbi:carbon-nitrogen hydrolase family protein [Streptosporangium sp. NPDC048865]|uniref:carbon-nitrogen hydrolase family protein n=1 Tax=Streptosporangium sp. NPDC048865 TaxID=3155766 RepID=UPI0034414C40